MEDQGMMRNPHLYTIDAATPVFKHLGDFRRITLPGSPDGQLVAEIEQRLPAHLEVIKEVLSGRVPESKLLVPFVADLGCIAQIVISHALIVRMRMAVLQCPLKLRLQKENDTVKAMSAALPKVTAAEDFARHIRNHCLEAMLVVLLLSEETAGHFAIGGHDFGDLVEELQAEGSMDIGDTNSMFASAAMTVMCDRPSTSFVEFRVKREASGSADIVVHCRFPDEAIPPGLLAKFEPRRPDGTFRFKPGVVPADLLRRFSEGNFDLDHEDDRENLTENLALIVARATGTQVT